MDEKHRILVDGFNLGLKKGSGIKTYGMTLLDAYQVLGYEVGVLMDNQFLTGKDALLDEVSLFDQDEVRPKGRFNLMWLKHLKTLSYLFRKRSGNVVVPRITEPDPENYLTFFMKLDNVKFKAKVVPGDTLIFDLSLITPIRRGIVHMRGRAFVGNTLVSEAELMAQITK